MSKSNEPRRHHYVPKFLLEHFVDDGGMLHVFDKQHPERGVFKSPPKNVFLERDFNTTLDSNRERDYRIENEFSQIEGLASQIITKVIHASQEGKFSNISPDDKNTLDRFVHTMCSRSPEFRAYFKANWEEPFRERYDQRSEEEGAPRRWNNFPKEERERYLDNALREFPLMTHRTISETPPFPLQSLSNKRIYIATVRPARKSFIIGSNPVVLIPNANLEDIEEAWLPVSHNVLVGYCSESRFVNDLNYLEEKAVCFSNEKMAEQSQIIAGRSGMLIESLSRPYQKRKA